MSVHSLLAVNIKLLKIWSLYPPNPDANLLAVIADKLYKYINVLCLYCIFLPCVYELYIGEKSKITDYTLNIMNTGAYLCSILTLHFFHTRGEKGYELVTEMHENFKYSADTNSNETNMEKVDKLTRKITKGFFSLLTCGVICMALVPLILPGRVLPIPGEYPFDWKKTPAYQLVYLLQFYAQIVIGSVTSSSDVFFICILLVAAEQFKVLGADFHSCLYKTLTDAGFTTEEIVNFRRTLGETEANLDRLFRNSKKSNNEIITTENSRLLQGIESDNFQKNLRSVLAGYIKHHQMLLNFCAKMEEFFWPLISMKVAISLFYHIFITFALVTSTDTSMAITLAQYELCAVTELFIFALAGQILIDESENVREMLYTSPWYYSNRQYQKTVIMILMRCDRPARASIGKLVNMSLPAFITIMKTALSYFAVLRQVTE